jgi:GNAT superfamily N-acetyltransferase
MSVRPSQPVDRDAIRAVTAATGVFNAEEVETAIELFDAYVHDPQCGYNFLSDYDAAGSVRGYACWGPASLSRGAADLYWICTDPQAQGQGVGAALFAAVVDAVRAAGRWLIMIWTSSQPAYEPARRFYARMGCTLSLQLKDFYDRGDDLCIYTFSLDDAA